MKYARVYVDDHYPGDVLGGALVGVAVAVLLVKVGPLRALMDRVRGLIDRVIVALRLPLSQEG